MQKDRAAELVTRFDAFLTKLATVIELLPVYLKFDPKKLDLHNLTGFIQRHKHRHKHGETGRVKEEIKYDELCQLLKNLHKHGMALKAEFYSEEGELGEKVIAMQEMSKDNRVISLIMAYFAASTTLGLIQNDIKPLLTSLGESVRIAPSTEFLKEFKALMELATNRSSKISMMLGAVDHEAEGQLVQIRARIDELAKVSDLIVGLNIFTANPVKKSEEQLARERIAQQLAEEAGAKPEESPEVRVIRDFYLNFDLMLLPPFIDHIRMWEEGEKDSLKFLTNNISTFFGFHDRDFMSTEPKFVHAEITSAEFAELVQGLRAFKENKQEEPLKAILFQVKEKNTKHQQKQRDERSIANLRVLGILNEGPMSSWRPLPPAPTADHGNSNNNNK